MAITNAQETEILKVVAGLFNAAPGGTYLTELANLVEGGMTTSQLADALAAHTLFTNTVMAGKVTTVAQVAVLMDNFGLAVGNTDATSADAQAEAYFTQQIEGGVGFGQIVYDAVTFLSTTTDTAFTTTATLLANKALVAAAYSESTSSTDLITLQNVLSNVTGTAPYTAADVAAVLEGSGSSGGQSFSLTDDGAVLTNTVSNNVTPDGKLSSGNDTINAFSYPTAGTTTISDVSTTDNDILNVTAGATAISFASVGNIETVNVTSTNDAAAVTFSEFSGTNTLNVLGTKDLAIADFVNDGSVTLGLKGSSDVTATTADAGTDDDEFNISLNGAAGSFALTDGAAGAAEVTVSIESTGSATNELTLTPTVADFVVDEIVITGAAGLELTTAVATLDLTGITINADDATGSVTLITNDTTALDAANWSGVDNLTLTGNYNAAITDLNAGAAVELQAATTAVTIGQDGADDAGSDDDALTVILNAETGAITQTAITADAIEALTINSTTSDDATNTITALNADALDELIITGDADLTITGFGDQIGKLTAGSFEGNLTADFSTNTAAVLIVLGGGDDAITVSGFADKITTGDGEDTVTFADGDSSTTTLVEITDFTVGTDADVLEFGAAATYEEISGANQTAIDEDTTLADAVDQAIAQLVANEVTVFIWEDNAYALFEDGTNAGTYEAAEDTLVKLTGITSVDDFVAGNFA